MTDGTISTETEILFSLSLSLSLSLELLSNLLSRLLRRDILMYDVTNEERALSSDGAPMEPGRTG